MKTTPDWDTLIQKHLDGLTTEEEAKALSARIVEDAEVRSSYLKAAQLHGALADETLTLLPEEMSGEPEVAQASGRAASRLDWPRQIAAGLVAGLFVGLLGVGVVWAVSSPKSLERSVEIAHGDFETLPEGQVPKGFPIRFGEWGGDPSEVIAEADGNQVLRFLETANVTGNPNGIAAACNVFQLVDLSALRKNWDTGNPETQFTLELSATFRREAAPNDVEVPRLKATCAIHLYQAEPELIGEAWPHVISEAVSIGKKSIRLKPSDEPATISASCLLAPEATLALISVNVNTMSGSRTPVKLGGYFVDDVQLTVIQQPKLPVQVVKQ